MMRLSEIKMRKTLNKALLRKVALRLRRLRHEEHYNQNVFADQNSCGTTCCIAGHVLLEAKACSRRDLVVAALQDDHTLTRDSTIAEAARRLLGLGYSEAYKLFDACGSNWPGGFSDRFGDALDRASAERPSRVAAALLNALANGKVTL